MQVKKSYLAIGLAAVAVAAVGVFIWMWVHAAPECVRLLPDSDAVLYVNLTPLRLANAFSSVGPINRAAEYQDFIQQTGFDFERDLDEVGVAIHLPAPTPAPNADGPGAAGEPRFSELFKGRFDRARVSSYFRKIAQSTEIYRNKDIYTVPVENRRVRVTILSSTQVAVSNTESPQAIHEMIDRSPESGLPFIAPALVRMYYKEVPFGSVAWAIGKFGSSAGGSNVNLPGGFGLPVPAQTVWVGSLRYAGALEFKVQALASSEDDARKIAETLGTFLTIFRSAQTNVGTQAQDHDVNGVFDSLQVTQEGTRTVLTATVPLRVIKKLIPEGAGSLTNPRSGKDANPTSPGTTRNR